MATKRFTLELSVDQYDFLRKEALAMQTTVVGFIRQLIENHRNRPLRKTRHYESDPLGGRQGSFDGPADLAENHDRYLYGKKSK
jgi:hypothetical protein